VLAARERYRRRVSVQIVAFPQSGVMRCPGVLELLDAAMQSGADLVGRIDPLEIDRDSKRCYGASGEDEASSSLDTTDGDAPCRSQMT
jgi:hypothetical protein